MNLSDPEIWNLPVTEEASTASFSSVRALPSPEYPKSHDYVFLGVPLISVGASSSPRYTVMGAPSEPANPPPPQGPRSPGKLINIRQCPAIFRWGPTVEPAKLPARTASGTNTAAGKERGRRAKCEGAQSEGDALRKKRRPAARSAETALQKNLAKHRPSLPRLTQTHRHRCSSAWDSLASV